MSSSGPCAPCPAPLSLIGICHWTPELAGPPLVPCAFHRWEQVHPEHMWQGLEKPWRILCCLTSFGGGSVMVWGGTSMEGRTDLYRLDNGTLTDIGNRDEILGPIVRPYSGAVGPGFLLVHDNARPHVARVCRQFLEDKGIDTIEWPPRSPDLNPKEHLWDILFHSIRPCQVAPQTVQELSDALVQIWEEIPQDTIRRLIRSMPDIVRHAYKHVGAIQTTEYHLICCNEISAKCCIIFSTLIFGCLWIQPSVGW